MEIKLKNKFFVATIILLATITSCKGQEYTKKQLDSLYSKRYRLYDTIQPQEVKINGLYTINEHQKLFNNIENIFGKADNYEKYGPFPEEGIDEIGYDYTYGCESFDDCKKKRGNKIPFNIINFSQYPNENRKAFSFININLKKHNKRDFYLTLKGKKITIGNTLEEIKLLFPNSYKYFKLLSENKYSVGFHVMIFSENKKIYFGLDKDNNINNIEIDEIE